MCSQYFFDTATYFNHSVFVITITILALSVYIHFYQVKATGDLCKKVRTIQSQEFAKNGVKLVEQGYRKASNGGFDIVSLNGEYHGIVRVQKNEHVPGSHHVFTSPERWLSLCRKKDDEISPNREYVYISDTGLFQHYYWSEPDLSFHSYGNVFWRLLCIYTFIKANTLKLGPDIRIMDARRVANYLLQIPTYKLRRRHWEEASLISFVQNPSMVSSNPFKPTSKILNIAEWQPSKIQQKATRVLTQVMWKLALGDNFSKTIVGVSENYHYTHMRALADLKAATPILLPLNTAKSKEIRQLHQCLEAATKFLTFKKSRAGMAASSSRGTWIEWLIRHVSPEKFYDDRYLTGILLAYHFGFVFQTGPLITQILYELAFRPEYIRLIEDEAQEVLGSNASAYTRHNLRKLTQLDSFCKETHRHHPTTACKSQSSSER